MIIILNERQGYDSDNEHFQIPNVAKESEQEYSKSLQRH